MTIPRFYCALCWDQFDNPEEHNFGSWLGRERLDGFCRGDIRRSNPTIHRKIKAIKQTEALPLDSGEPIKL